MNVEKLKRLQAQVRIGGKGTPRRKKKVIHQTTAADDKKLQSSLKKLSVSTIPGIEEVNIIKDDLTVIHFNNPKAQASLSANTFSVTGHGDTKKIVEMLPEILPQLGQETVTQLRVFAGSMTNNQKQLGDRVESNLLASIEEDDVPLLVNDFDEIATKEDVTKGKTPESKSEQQHSRIESCLNKAKTDNIQGGSWCQNAILNDERKFCRESTANNSLPQSDGKEHNARTRTTDKTTNATSVTTTEKTGVSVKIGSSKLKTEGSKGTLISSKTNIGNVPDKYLNIRREGEYEVKAILENLPLNELHVIDVDSYAYLNRKITNSPTLESTEVIYTDQSAAKPKLSTGKTRKGNFADGKADAGKVKAVSSELFKPDLCCVPAEDKLKLISTEKGSNALKETQPIILDSGNVKDITHQTNNVVMAAHYEANKKGNAKQLMNLDTGVAKMGTAESKSVNLAKLQTVSMSSLILKGQEHDIQKQRIGAGLATNSTHGFESNEVSIHEVAKNTSLVAATFSPYAKKMSSAVNTFSLEIETGGYEKAKCTERPVSLELGLEDIKPLEENLTTLREIGNVSLTNMPPESKIEASQEPLIKAHDPMAVEDKGADATNSVDEKLSLCSEIRKEIYEEIYAQSKAQDATNKTIEKKPHSKVVKDIRKQQIKTLSPTTSTKTDAGLMKLNITEKPKKVLPPKAQTPSVSSSISTAQKIPITSSNRQEKSAVIPKPKLTVASPIKPQAGMPTKPPTTTHAKKPPTSPSSTDRTMKSTTATKSLHGGEPNAAIKSKTDNTKRDKILSRNPPGQGNQP